MQLTLGLDLSTLTPNQVEALVDLVYSFKNPYVIPSSDETAEHEAPAIAPRRKRQVGCTTSQGTLNVHDEDEVCDICERFEA